MHRVKSIGYYCTVCEENFNPDDIEEIKGKEWTDKKKEQKIERRYESAREDFLEHWDNHHW